MILKSKSRRESQRPSGLTLLELLLVLVILTVVATVAVESIEPKVDQSRFERTQQTLENVSEAITGRDDRRLPDGSVALGGFVADVGRPPLVLDELWTNGNGISPFGPQTPQGDSEVVISAGWNGPYVQLPVGGAALLDAWGNPFDVFQKDGTPSGATDPIHIIRSRGRDAVALAGTGYDTDIDVAVSATNTAVDAGLTGSTVNRIEKTLTVYVYYQSVTQNPDPAKGSHVIVRIYGPLEGKAATVATDDVEIEASKDEPVAITFSNVTVGPKIIRAYQADTSPTNDDAEITAKTISTAQRAVISRYTSSIQLILNDTSTP